MKIALITASLELTAAGGVAAPEIAGEVDLPLARDGNGAPTVPGSSIAGSLRDHLTTALGAEQTRGLMGYVDGNEATVSTLLVLGSKVSVPTDVHISVRQLTAIDARRGAAKDATLRKRELLPPGSTVAVFLRVDDAPNLPLLLDALAHWRPVIGGGRSRGTGRTVLTDLRFGTLDLADPHHLLAWLTMGGPRLHEAVAIESVLLTGQSDPDSDDTLIVPFTIADALHVGAGGSGQGPAPVLKLGRTPIIPGSTWKGVLRQRCEWIARSCGITEPDPRWTALQSLFGTAPRGHDDLQPARRGVLCFQDSRIEGAESEDRTHVAIDRFTGGAADGLLYAEEVVTSGGLALEVSGLRTCPPWTRGMLLLALRDVHEGYMGVGGGTTRGQGSLAAPADTFAPLAEGHPVGESVRSYLFGG